VHSCSIPDYSLPILETLISSVSYSADLQPTLNIYHMLCIYAKFMCPPNQIFLLAIFGFRVIIFIKPSGIRFDAYRFPASGRDQG
jgi:hypothetical protein